MRAVAVFLCVLGFLAHIKDARAADDSQKGPVPNPLVEFRKWAIRGLRTDQASLERIDAFAESVPDGAGRAEVLRFKAECLRKAGRIEDASALFRDLIGSSVVDEATRLELLRSIAECSWIKGDLGAAEKEFGSILDRMAGLAAPATGKLREVMDLLEVSCRQHRAAVLTALGRHDEALEAYEDAIRMNSPPRPIAESRGFTNARAALNRSALLLGRGEQARGLEELARVRHLDPSFLPCHIEYRLFQESPEGRSPADRTAFLQGLIARYPDDDWTVYAMVQLVYSLHEEEREPESELALMKVLARPPVSPGAYGGLVRDAEVDAWLRAIGASIAKKEYDVAEQLLRRALDRYGSEPRVLSKKDKYIELLGSVKARDPNAEGGDTGVEGSHGGRPQGETEVVRLNWFLVANTLAIALGAVLWISSRRRSRLSALAGGDAPGATGGGAA